MRIGVNKTLHLLIIAAVLVASSSCSLTQGKGIAEAAVVQFHNQYNAGQFRELYGQADAEFKKSASEADFVALLEALRRKLGTVNQSSQAQWNVNATTMGTMVTLAYNVEFSEGNAVEQFVFRTFSQLVELSKNYNKDGHVPKDAPKEVVIYDISDQTASVKLTAVWGIDYMHLAKYDGKWKIINVLWQTPPKK